MEKKWSPLRDIRFLVAYFDNGGFYMGLNTRKPVLRFENNKGADQRMHLRKPAHSDQRLCYSLVGKYPI